MRVKNITQAKLELPNFLRRALKYMTGVQKKYLDFQLKLRTKIWTNQIDLLTAEFTQKQLLLQEDRCWTTPSLHGTSPKPATRLPEKYQTRLMSLPSNSPVSTTNVPL